jgi:hypothetical protein
LRSHKGRIEIKMKLIKVVFLVLSIAFVIIQFIRPSWNKSEEAFPHDISNVITVPDSVKTLLHIACYNCHSNNTEYPWYGYVQPVGWYLEGHIKDAQKSLNFNEFGNYSARRKASKLNDIANEIRENGMPLPSYRLLHKDARLSQAEKDLLINWAQMSEESISHAN